MTLRRKLIQLALLVGMIGLLLTSAGPASGSHEAPEVTSDAGVLRLHLNTDGDYFRFDPVSGPPLQQDLSTPQNCLLKSNGATLVALSAAGGSNPKVGLVDHSAIGTKVNGEGNGQKCGQINNANDQELTLTLAGSLAGKAIDNAEIDLGCKFNGAANIELIHGGTTVDNVSVNFTGSDCGPDSGSADNRRVVIDDKIFDTLVITVTSPPNGAVSLQGGKDNTMQGPLGVSLGLFDTLFNIVDVFEDFFDCGVPKEADGGAGDAIGTFILLDDGLTCEPKGVVTFDADGNRVDLIPGGTSAARFVGKIEFPPRDDSLSALTLRYDKDGPTGGEAFVNVPACDLTGPVVPEKNAALAALGSPVIPTTDAVPPGVDTWCMIVSQTVSNGLSQFVTTSWVVGFEDPIFQGV